MRCLCAKMTAEKERFFGVKAGQQRGVALQQGVNAAHGLQSPLLLARQHEATRYCTTNPGEGEIR